MATKANPASKPAAKQPKERRQARRRQAALGTIYQFGDASVLGELGLVWNLSTNGVSVLSNRACHPGERLEGQLKTLDDKSTLPVAFQVAHVKELGTGDYFVAGPFDRKIPAAKLRAFVG